MNIAIYNKSTKILHHIINDAEIFSNEIKGSNKTMKGFSGWVDYGFITIPDSYNLADHISGSETITQTDPITGESHEVTVPTYDNGAYIEGELIPNSDSVVDEYDATAVQAKELGILVTKKVRRQYTLDNENELNRKMNAVNNGILDSSSDDGIKAISDFTAYNTYVEQCITEAKSELGI